MANDPKRDDQPELHQEYNETAAALDLVKKDIQNQPDARYLKRKELGAEIKSLKEAICEQLADDEEVTLGTQRFKKKRLVKVRYNKDRIREYCDRRELDPTTYDTENAEDVSVLKKM